MAKAKKKETVAVEEAPSEVEEVPSEIPPPPALDPKMSREDLAKHFLSEMAKETVKSNTDPKRGVDPRALGYDPATTVPLWDGPYSAFYVLRTSAEDPDRLVWDLVFMPGTPGKVLVKYPLEFPTKWGVQPTSGYNFTTVIKNETTDHENSRIAPVKVLVGSDEMLRQCISPPKILEGITYEELLAGTEIVEKHDATIISQDRQNARREAETWKEVVKRGYGSHFQVSGELSEKGQKAEERGTESTAKTFYQAKNWIEQIKENWICIIILFIIFVVVALQNAGVIEF